MGGGDWLLAGGAGDPESFMGKFYQILVECSAHICMRGGFVQIVIANSVAVRDAASDCR